jgi:hypothetical protein
MSCFLNSYVSSNLVLVRVGSIRLVFLNAEVGVSLNEHVTERDAMGCDEYQPLTKTGSNLTDQGGIGYTVVDSLDTMQIMGLQDEYTRARDWIAHNMTFDKDANFNTFEVR